MNDYKKKNEFIVHSAEFVKGALKPDQYPEDDLPQIAFAGRSNVGKSSLQNSLLGRKKLVKVSGTPGKTREINFFLINESFYFVDLPGIGYAKLGRSTRKVMEKGLDAYTQDNPKLAGIIYLLDLKTGGTELDIFSVETLRDRGIPVLLVGTKKDKLNQKELNQSLKKIRERFGDEGKPLLTSSLKKSGLQELWLQVQNAINGYYKEADYIL